MRNKKAQTSLEYLMTYGWAILIVIGALVVVWQMGLFQPKSVPKGYSGFWGIVPGDFLFNSEGTLTLSLQNNGGALANVTEINVTVGEEKYSSGKVNYGIFPGGRKLWGHTFSSAAALPKGSRFEMSLWVDYNDSRTSRIYRSSGKLWGSVEASE